MENSMAIGKRFLGYVNKQPMFIGETFLQNDITLLLSSFRTLSKWNVQWMALKSHSASFIWNRWTCLWQSVCGIWFGN